MSLLERSGDPRNLVEAESLHVLLPSPVGPVGIDFLGEVIVGVLLSPKGEAAERFRPFEKVARSEFLDEAVGRFSEYFAGARRRLDLPFHLGPSGVRGFGRRVLKETSRIPYGRTRSYQQIAESAGNPDGYRQVLSTLLANPLPIVVPCHRVVTNKSGVGGYIAGAEIKTWLLTMENRFSGG